MNRFITATSFAASLCAAKDRGLSTVGPKHAGELRDRRCRATTLDGMITWAIRIGRQAERRTAKSGAEDDGSRNETVVQTAPKKPTAVPPERNEARL